jgi:stress response protein YsnF
VRRFITTEEVETPITLHQQHIEVIRRVVADPNMLDGIDWEDRAIEIIETDEEPVVRKTAHVTEEIVVHKTESDRIEKVRGTIRRQQVQVDRVPGKH